MKIRTLDEFIQWEIQRTALKQLYLESTPQNLAEWYWFFRSMDHLWIPTLVNLMMIMGLERQYARRIARMVVTWIINGYYPSGHARFTLDE